MKFTQRKIYDILGTIPDPELGISIMQLGLIYGVEADKKGNVHIVMTLTTIGCPLFDQIETPIREAVGKLKGVKSVDIDLTFEPPWNPDMMDEEARLQLGFA